ncbi:hypothetical protein ACNRWW_02045 [Metabacillus sp. HB246100]
MKKLASILIFLFLLTACNNKVNEIESNIIQIDGSEIALDVTKYVSKTDEDIGYDLRTVVEKDTEIIGEGGDILALEDLQPGQSVQVIFDKPIDLTDDKNVSLKKITVLE